MSVHSNLGGGRHGHLGLLLSRTSYELVSPIPYVRPPYPPAPMYPPFLTHQQVAAIQSQHKEAVQVFHE